MVEEDDGGWLRMIEDVWLRTFSAFCSSNASKLVLCQSSNASQNERKKSAENIPTYFIICWWKSNKIHLFFFGATPGFPSFKSADGTLIQSQPPPPSLSIGPREEQMVCSLRHDCLILQLGIASFTWHFVILQLGGKIPRFRPTQISYVLLVIYKLYIYNIYVLICINMYCPSYLMIFPMTNIYVLICIFMYIYIYIYYTSYIYIIFMY